MDTVCLLCLDRSASTCKQECALSALTPLRCTVLLGLPGLSSAGRWAPAPPRAHGPVARALLDKLKAAIVPNCVEDVERSALPASASLAVLKEHHRLGGCHSQKLPQLGRVGRGRWGDRRTTAEAWQVTQKVDKPRTKKDVIQLKSP